VGGEGRCECQHEKRDAQDLPPGHGISMRYGEGASK
jgi:hypothetical protein